MITRAGNDIGKNLETIVFHHLRKKYGRVFYWREKGEIDFVVQEGQNILAFQVSRDGIKERHKRAAEEFHEVFPQAGEIPMITMENIISFLKS